MSQPKSLDQLHKECREELLAGTSGGIQRGPDWLQHVPNIGNVVWGLIGSFVTYLMQFRPIKAQQKDQLDELKKLRTDVQAWNEKQIALLEQLLTTLRGNVTPDTLNGARDEVHTHAEGLGVPEPYAEELAHIVADKVGKPLLAPPGQGPSGSGHPGQPGPE